LRLYSVYGPYEDPSRLIPRTILAGFERRYPPLANPAIARDFIFTEDVNDAFLLAAAGPHPEYGAVYNVGTGVQTTLREVADLSRVVFDITEAPPWGTMPDRAWDTTAWVADSALLQNTLGWRPRHSLEEGFRHTARWFQHRGLRPPYLPEK
jgi:dolichol-phosphate mannosyltransferase